MALKNISQKRWLKGLNAAFGLLSQPSNIVPRVSNLLWTRRGSAITCDGTSIFALHNSILFPPFNVLIGAFLELFLYQPVGQVASYFGLVKFPPGSNSPPTAFTLADGGAGALSAGNYGYFITSTDGAGGESQATTGSIALGAARKTNLGWNTTILTNGVNIYRTKAGVPGTYYFVAAVPAIGGGAGTYVDNTPDVSLTTVFPLPASDTNTFTAFVSIPPANWFNIIFNFPPDAYNVTGNPLGGEAGNTDAVPLILQFANLMFLALGNGIRPYTSDGTTPNTIPITNTFTATYPAWQAATVYVVGDQIDANIAGVHYLFTTTQSGTSAAGIPAFSPVLGSTVTDNQIIWKNSGKISTSPAPRGAAHIEIYAGSIWVANTSPTLTTDQLDGPSALRMSDANNPNSWNPLNAAQIARDNGQQITGIKTFSVAEAGIPTSENLIVFKDFSTFIVQGVFGSSNFAIQQAQTDLGCVAARSIQFVPGFGIVRLTHLGFAVFDGVRDRIISEEIRPFLFPVDPDITPMDWSFSWNAKGAQVAAPPMYVCAVPQSAKALGTLAATLSRANVVQAIPAGNYYAILYMQDTSGNYFATPEFGPLALDGTHGIGISLPVFPLNAVKYILYYGTVPGGENKAITIPAASMGHIYLNTAVGVAGVPTTTIGLTRIFCYDLVLKAWSIVDLPFSINVLKQFRAPKAIPVTFMAGFYDGAVRKWQVGDSQWDAGAVNAGASNNIVQWNIRTAEVYSEGATRQIFFDKLAIRGRASDTDFYSAGIKVIEAYNGQDFPPDAAFVERFPSSNQFDARFDQKETAENFHATLSGQGVVELESIDHEVEAKPLGRAGKVIS